MEARFLLRLGFRLGAIGAALFAAAWMSAAGPRGAAEVTVRSDVAYLAPARAEKLDLYFPPEAKRSGRAPAVVWIHGGGWMGGQKTANREKNVCRALAAEGYVCASIDYKLGPGAWPQNLLDCKNAVRFLRARSAELGIDPERIAVGGGSAGGHLALMVGLTAGVANWEPAEPYPGIGSDVRCILDLYGITNLLTRRETEPDGTPTNRRRAGGALAVFGATSPDAEVLKTVSPVAHVTSKSPPVLILHGRADTTVDYWQSEELARVLREHGVPHELVLVERAGHTFDLQMWNRKPLSRDLRPVVTGFLEKYNR